MSWLNDRFDSALAWWLRHERRAAAAAFLLGFSFDLYLASRPDSLTNNILLLAYLFIAAASIVTLNLRTSRAEAPMKGVRLFLLLILQFCFGGLANNLLILYGKSGTFGGTAVFAGILILFIFGNEYLRNRYTLLRFNVAIYYFLLLTYCVIAAPTFIFHTIGTVVFLESVGISLVVMALLLFVLILSMPHGKKRFLHAVEVSGIVLAELILFCGLYFYQIIPPVPLSIKSIGIYHSLSRDTSDNYSGTYEPASRFVFWRDTSATYTYAVGELAYCFSAVFAPGGLETPVIHEWKYYNSGTKLWESRQTTSFKIIGGRAGGYRGYSLNTNLASGAWRCDIETPSRQVIGRISFSVVESTSTVPLSTATL